jgi:hypothetical protein
MFIALSNGKYNTYIQAAIFKGSITTHQEYVDNDEAGNYEDYNDFIPSNVEDKSAANWLIYIFYGGIVSVLAVNYYFLGKAQKKWSIERNDN